MSALLSVTIKVKDPAGLKEYISQVPATMAPHGAKMLARGKIEKQLRGERAHQMEALFEFPDAEAINAWHDSDAYQALIEQRDRVCDMTLSVLAPF